MNAEDLLSDDKVVMMIAGWPGGGKTGAIAALLNAGYKVRYVDFEGNYKPLLTFTDRDKLANLDIFTTADDLRGDHKDMGKAIEPAGIPTAFNGALRMLQDEWKYTAKDGTEVNLGRSKEWGSDTIVVVDSLTSMGEAAFRRARKMMNKTAANTTAAVWGAAVDDQIALIQALKHPKRRHHLIFLAHLQMIGPDVPMFTKDDENTGMKDIKAQIAEEKADLMSTRLYPRAVTRNASQVIAKEFPVLIQAERRISKGQPVRVLRTTSGEELDLKFPAKTYKPEYPIETGLADMFELLGATAPGAKQKGA